MTTSISIKKVLVSVGAMALLLSPLFAMATFEEKAALLGQLEQAMKDNADKIGSNTTLANAVRDGKKALAGAQAAAKKGDLQRAITLLTSIRSRFLGKWKNTLGEPFEGIILQLLQALNNNIDELKKQAQQPKSGAPAATPAGTSKLPPLPIKLEDKIINALQFNVVMGKDPKGRDVVNYTATGGSTIVGPKTQIRIFESVNGKKKLITTVTFAKKGACKTKKSNTATCMATFLATPEGVKAATGNVTAEVLLLKGKKPIATLDVRGGKQFGPGGDGRGVAVTAKIATLLAREKEACDIIIHRFAQFNTAVSEGNGALSTSDARAELRKLLDAAVAACGISNLTDEKKALEKVLADLKNLMGERIGSSPTSGGVRAISLSGDPKVALEGLYAIFQDKFTIIADLMSSGVIDTKLSASAAPATPSTPTPQPTQPQTPSPDQSGAPATGGGAQVTCPATETTGDTKRCVDNNIQYCLRGQWYNAPSGGPSICSPDGTQGARCEVGGTVVHVTCGSSEVCSGGYCVPRSTPASAPGNSLLGSLLKIFGR